MLRQAEIKDLPEIISIATLLRLDIPQFVWNEEDFVTRQIANSEYFLKEHEGKIIGIMSLRERGGKIHIETLVVTKEHQSKGIGSEFITFAKEVAKNKGVDTIHAYSFKEYNIVDFYVKKGFRLLDHIGSYHDHPYYCLELTV